MADIHLPFSLIDSHFHASSMTHKGFDVVPLLQDCFSQGLVAAIDAGIDEQDFQTRLELAQSFPRLFLGAGIHPCESGQENWEERFEAIVQQCQHPKVVAIGETGLDYYWDNVERSVQHRAFSQHLELAAHENLPIIVHNREADDDVIKQIQQSSCRTGVMHCFSSDWSTAKKALDLGFSLSFAGNISYGKNEAVLEAARNVPIERLLIETDAPYLSPRPRRGKPNHPGHVGYTLEFLCDLRGISVEEGAKQTTENARRLFALEKAT